ncbi:MAG: 5-oxoprolinase subunit PxpB [Pyrinomonadaceae bacterium]
MNEHPKYNIFPLGENALTISFGNTISPEINSIAASLSRRIESSPFHGFIECLPAYSSVSVFFDSLKVKDRFRTALTAYQIAKSHVEIALDGLEISAPEDSREIEIPVSFDKKDAPDLSFVAEFAELSEDNVVQIFLSQTYKVYVLGFLPGFAYMGEVDPRIVVPRKETPRKEVKKGSVGIAGNQTGIYPLDSPGGWQIIGKTETVLFTPHEDPPVLFSPGDTVKFVKI